MAEKRQLFEMRHTRVPAQRERMEKCIELDICPFCWENLNEWHDAPVIMKGDFWAITANDHPYEGKVAKFHFLAIYKYHISSITEIASGAGEELLALFSEIQRKYGIQGATIIMRNGDMTYTGASVFHLHAQIMSGVSLDEFGEEKPKFPDDIITTILGYKAPGSK